MTALEKLKTILADIDNNIFDDVYYSNYLMLFNIDPSDENVEIAKIFLIKANLLETISDNPKLFENYAQGDISKQYKKEELRKQAQAIFRRYAGTKL
jgi:hypothetical protein